MKYFCYYFLLAMLIIPGCTVVYVEILDSELHADIPFDINAEVHALDEPEHILQP